MSQVLPIFFLPERLYCMTAWTLPFFSYWYHAWLELGSS